MIKRLGAGCVSVAFIEVIDMEVAFSRAAAKPVVD